MAMNQRHSHKRDAILECLSATATHPTADWLYEALRARQVDVSRATVYRNLSQLRAQGRIISVGTVGGFERFDYNTLPHAHFVCTRCHRVLDVADLPVSRELCELVGLQLGARVESGWLMFSGICSDCLGEN